MRKRLLLALTTALFLLAACVTPEPPATFVVVIPTRAPATGETGSTSDPLATTTSDPLATTASDSAETAVATTQADLILEATQIGETATLPPDPPPTLTLTASPAPPTETATATETATPTFTPEPSPTLTPAPTQFGPATPTVFPVTQDPDSISVVGRTDDGITEIMVDNRDHVVSLAFLPDGRLLFTEKDGRVMLRHSDGQLYTVLQLPTETDNECGMIGIAVDPSFASTGYLWTFHNVSGSPHKMEIVRFSLQGTAATNPEVAASFTRLGGVCGHNAGTLHFGSDGLLYITIGDNEEPANAQNLEVVPGKIHRFKPTMPLETPDEGPVEGSSIYAWGLRNSFDFDWDPLTNLMWATENGTYCDDEINLIVPGGNYGWRPAANNACENTKVDPNTYPYKLPVTNWETSQAPTALLFYTGDMFPKFKNELLFCTFTNKWAQRFHLTEDRTNFNSWARIDLGEGQCESDMAQAPDGTLWFAAPSTIYRLRAP